MNIVISVQEDARGTKKENWKDPFKKLKFSAIRAEKKWVILLAVNEKEVKKIYKLCDSLHVETVVEDEQHVSWEDKTASSDRKFSPSVAGASGFRWNPMP